MLETIAYEGFDYPVSRLIGKDGGTGWSTPWKAAYGVSDYDVIAAGLTYPGLDTVGGAIQWGTSSNQVVGTRRELPRIHEGVIFVQVLTHFTSQTGGGTPQIRFADDSTGVVTRTFALGNNGQAPMSILSADGNVMAATTVSMNQRLLNVIRIDYDTDEIALWVNPDLSTFDYASPPAADAHVSGFAPTFSMIDPYSRFGVRFDEFRVMRLRELPPPPPVPIPAGPPRAVEAVASDAAAIVSWQPPENSGSFTISHYIVESFPDRHVCLTATTTCVVGDLRTNVDYTFVVRALTGAGWGARSEPSTAIRPFAQRIEIRDSSTHVRNRPGIVIQGETVRLPAGTELVVWLKFPHERRFQKMPVRARTDESGTFTWQRRLSRIATIYVTTLDGKIVSNRVVVDYRT